MIHAARRIRDHRRDPNTVFSSEHECRFRPLRQGSCDERRDLLFFIFAFFQALDNPSSCARLSKLIHFYDVGEVQGGSPVLDQHQIAIRQLNNREWRAMVTSSIRPFGRQTWISAFLDERWLSSRASSRTALSAAVQIDPEFRIRRKYIHDLPPRTRKKRKYRAHTWSWRDRDFFVPQRREKERRKSLASIVAEEHTEANRWEMRETTMAPRGRCG